MDPFEQMKEVARRGWASFVGMETVTGTVAPKLVKFAGIERGRDVLDVGCGTGVVSLVAARLGARVTGSDLTPELIARAKENAAIAQLDVTWEVADVEALPYANASFDVVVSQFGHMFAPRPDFALKEMLRVLRPGGRIAFATWPPELFTGRLFATTAKYAPPPPPGAASPNQWGEPVIVRERLGGAVRDVVFTRDTMMTPALSPQHARVMFESFGPMGKLKASLEESDPTKLALFRNELDELAATYFDANHIRQDFLLTRAVKV